MYVYMYVYAFTTLGVCDKTILLSRNFRHYVLLAKPLIKIYCYNYATRTPNNKHRVSSFRNTLPRVCYSLLIYLAIIPYYHRLFTRKQKKITFLNLVLIIEAFLFLKKKQDKNNNRG